MLPDITVRASVEHLLVLVGL